MLPEVPIDACDLAYKCTLYCRGVCWGMHGMLPWSVCTAWEFMFAITMLPGNCTSIVVLPVCICLQGCQCFSCQKLSGYMSCFLGVTEFMWRATCAFNMLPVCEVACALNMLSLCEVAYAKHLSVTEFMWRMPVLLIFCLYERLPMLLICCLHVRLPVF